MLPRAPSLAVLAAGALVAVAALTTLAPVPEEQVLEMTEFAPLPVDWDGPKTAPDRVRLTQPGVEGEPFFEATVVRDQLDPHVLISIAGPLESYHEVRGSLLVLGDLASPSFKLHTRDASSETFAAHVQNTGVSPSIDVWVNKTGDAPIHHHLESPLRYRVEDKQMQSLVVVDPTNPDRPPYLRLDRAGSGYRLSALGYSSDVTASGVEVLQPAEGRTAVVFRDGKNAEVQRITIDRTRDPATVTLQGEIEETLQGPLALQGDPANPKRLAVYDRDGAALLTYATGDGRSTLDVAGTRVLQDATFLHIEGDPLTESFTLHLLDSQGKQHKVYVDRDVLLAVEATTGVPAVQLLSPLSTLSGMPEGQLDLVQTERGAVLKSLQLDGAHPLAASGQHIAVLHTEDGAPAFERILLGVRVGDQRATSTFEHRFDTDSLSVWFATYTPMSIGSSLDGQTVQLDVHYEKRLAPLAVHRYHDADTYRYKLDAGAPSVQIDAPATSAHHTFDVSWSGADASGIRGYEAQTRESGAAAWQPWVTETSETSQTFSGEWGQVYDFRVRSIDGVGNPSAWAEATTVVAAKPAGQDDVNDPPTVRILSPRAGDRLTGVVDVTWDASDPDGTPVTVNVQVSPDDGITWRTLHSSSEGRTAWDTTLEPDGLAYRLRVTATDGTLSSADATGAFSLANHAVARQERAATGGGPASGADGDAGNGSGEGDAGTDGATPPLNAQNDAGAVDGAGAAPPEEKSGIPAPGPLALLATLGAAAYALRGGARRSR